MHDRVGKAAKPPGREMAMRNEEGSGILLAEGLATFAASMSTTIEVSCLSSVVMPFAHTFGSFYTSPANINLLLGYHSLKHLTQSTEGPGQRVL